MYSSCGSCVSKDVEINDLKHYIRTLEQKNLELQGRLEDCSPLKDDQTPVKVKQHKPKARTSVELADYYEVQKGDDTLRHGYTLLAPGATIAVSLLWLHGLLSSVSKPKRKKNKEKTSPGYEVVKRLMDGFFEPWDLAVPGGTTVFKDSAIFKALRSYAEHNLSMDQAAFNRAWSEKMSSSKATMKRMNAKK